MNNDRMGSTKSKAKWAWRPVFVLVFGLTAGHVSAQRPGSADLDALVKAAKAEGEVFLYSSLTENVPQRVGEAFAAKYGIKLNFIRLVSTTLKQRYAAEAEAGNIGADTAWVSSGSGALVEVAAPKMWIESISGLPVVKSGEFPAKFITNGGYTALVQSAPLGIAYNSEKLKGSNIPKEFQELLAPRFKGQILLPDPRSSETYNGFWSLVLEKYGEAFFAQLRAQNPRPYVSGVPATQALGAGEGMVAIPAVSAQVLGPKSKGVPIDLVVPSLTTGVETEVILTAVGKSKHPNAARLLANYVMSAEGNKILNADPGNSSMYDPGGLPKQYQSPKFLSGASREGLMKHLGY